MNEQVAKSLAVTLSGDAVFPMPDSRSWGVILERPDGRLAAIEGHAGWVYHDRAAYESFHRDGDRDGVVLASEWGAWDGGEKWARGLSVVLGTEEYWHSGGGIWLVFYRRPDSRFSVLGSESGAVYASRDEFEGDEYGEEAENHFFV